MNYSLVSLLEIAMLSIILLHTTSAKELNVFTVFIYPILYV